VGQNF
jgi:hypothetical protein